MKAQYDFAGYAPDGQLRLIVEARTRATTNASWAAGVRENLLGSLKTPAMFLLAVPDGLYLWEANTGPGELASYEITTDVFAPYFQRAGIRPGVVDPSLFEMVVGWWLSDLAAGVAARLPGNALVDRLHDVLTGGRVVHEAAA